MSTHTLFENQRVKRLSLVVVILLVGSVVSFIAMTTRSVNNLGVFGPEEEQAAVANRNLTDYTADGVLAYRWQAMAKYYEKNPVIENDLTDFSAEDVLAYRWQAMVRYYAQAPTNGRNLADYSADGVLAYRWQAMAQYYADHPEIRGQVQR